jgi:hypothetical protein
MKKVVSILIIIVLMFVNIPISFASEQSVTLNPGETYEFRNISTTSQEVINSSKPGRSFDYAKYDKDGKGVGSEVNHSVFSVTGIPAEGKLVLTINESSVPPCVRIVVVGTIKKYP